MSRCGSKFRLSAKVGLGTSTPTFKLSLDNDGSILAEGAVDSGAVLTTSGPGARFIWYPRKAAIRAGDPLGDDWDDANIGKYSSAFGVSTRASGEASFASGDNTTASGIASVATGEDTTASGDYSVAMGKGSTASGSVSMALGNGAQAVANNAIAIGKSAVASGANSVAIGSDITASGSYSTVIGHFAKATADNAIVFGIGVDSATPLVNNIPDSMMIGFNSDVPTLFIGPASGAGTTGNVGIGTTNPQGNLDVIGSIYQRGAAVHADYVFDPAYQLESIEDHAEFMWKNKHLPALSKAQTDEQGREFVELGTHQRGMLEELEKLHIYIEQMHNRIKELEGRLEAYERVSE